MEGPYRDLGSGFARLTGAESARRSPSRVRSVEDALREFLSNARDAGARNIYVASTLKARRYRTLTVIDDGRGVPEPYTDLIFEPGVTSHHLSAPPGSGLSLYHIRAASLNAALLSPRNPTAITATFDTAVFPERSLQSPSRPSRSNLLATVSNFAADTGASPKLFYASPARILVALLQNHIIQTSLSKNANDGDIAREKRGADSRRIRHEAKRLGLDVSLRTVQRALSGEIRAAEAVSGNSIPGGGGERRDPAASEGSPASINKPPTLRLEGAEIAEIEDILSRAARSRYAELEGVRVRSRPGEISITARIYEPEEEYD